MSERTVISLHNNHQLSTEFSYEYIMEYSVMRSEYTVLKARQVSALLQSVPGVPDKRGWVQEVSPEPIRCTAVLVCAV
jgi:hypothetical protein